MDLFKDIELDSIVIGENIYPRIHIMSMIKPDSIYMDDYFLLEKFEIDKSNAEQMNALSQALTYQSVLYYMNESLYMTSSIWMSVYDLFVPPSYIDIQDKFELGVQYIIDTDANIDKYVYVYRIMYYSLGSSFSSSYIAGVQSVNFIYNNIIPFLTPIKICDGEGALHRTDENGRIIVKGFPVSCWNPRYKGPIEYEKEKYRRVNIYNSFLYFNNKIEEIDNEIQNMWNSIKSISNEGIYNYLR